MDVREAQEFLKGNHRAVLITRRRDGGLQTSLVAVGCDTNGRAVVSSRETAFKTKNVLRDPQVAACVFTSRWYGPFIQIEGKAEVIRLPEAMEPLVEYYKLIAGEHPNWDEYREAMENEKRVLIRFNIDRAGPKRSG